MESKKVDNFYKKVSYKLKKKYNKKENKEGKEDSKYCCIDYRIGNTSIMINWNDLVKSIKYKF